MSERRSKTSERIRNYRRRYCGCFKKRFGLNSIGKRGDFASRLNEEILDEVKWKHFPVGPCIRCQIKFVGFFRF